MSNEQSDKDFERWMGEEYLAPAEVVRRNLMDRLQRGDLSIEDAEAKAQALGIPPLNSDPDPSEYDPMSLPTWPVPMALAWIMWGKADDVRRHWTQYRAACSEWRRYRLSGSPDAAAECFSAQLEAIEPGVSSFFFLQHDELEQLDAGNPPAMRAAAARELLWSELRASELQMTAIDVSTGQPSVIAPDKFDHLELPAFEMNGEKADTLHVRNIAAYSEPRLQMKDVCIHWPSAITPESDCVRWLTKTMKQSPDRRTKSRLDFQKEAIGKFQGLTSEAFGRAWKDAVKRSGAKAWSRAGRPPSKSPGKSTEKKKS